MNHVITTYGGGELFFLVFNGIAALFRQEGGLMVPLIRLSLMVGSVYVLILMLFRNHLMEGLRWLLWVIVATNLLFLPKTRVHIYDPLTNTHRDVDHVPLALGAFASITSQIGRHITEKLESVFTLPDYMPYHKTGTVFASSIMSQLGRFRITDPVFKGNMERFINQCVVYDAMIGHKYTLSDLYNAPNIWEVVTTNASPVLGFLYKKGNAPGETVPCRIGAQKLNSLWAAEINRATARYGKRVQNRELNQTAFNTELLGSMRLLSGALALADSAQNLLRQTLMIGALEEGSQNKLSELGSAQNYAAAKALLQQRSAYAAAGEIAARTLPLFKNVIEALSYALFIFIVVLALMPNGHRVLLTYCGILVWTQLWAPLYAVLNLIMTLYGRAETMAQGAQNGLTFLNSAAIINANADMTTLAAWLSVSIPFISYGILRQGAAAFVGLAQHLGSAMQSAASSAASETVSGNISLGNVSMGTQAYQNTSAFQHMTSPGYNASQFKALDTFGTETTSFAGGAQSFSDQAMSRLSVQIMGIENASFAIQESLSHALSVAQTKSIAASNATEAALQTSTNFLSHVNKELSSATDFSQTTSATDAKSLQTFNNYVEDIRQSNNLTTTQAREAAIAAHIGLDVGVLGGGIKSSFSDTKAFQDAVDSAKAIATQQNYGENLETILSAAQSFSERQGEGRLIELGTAATASLNRASHLRDEASLAQSQVDTLSQNLSSEHSHSLTVNKGLTQDILEFIARQPTNRGPTNEAVGPIGYARARHIIESGGAERASYLTHFQKENPQYAIQEIRSGEEQAVLTHQYDKQAHHLQHQATLDQKNSQNTESILNQGEAMGLVPHTAPIPPLKQPALVTQALITPVSMTQDSHRAQDSKPTPEHLSPERAQGTENPQSPPGAAGGSPPPFKEQVAGFLKKTTSTLKEGQTNMPHHKEELKKAAKALEKEPVRPTTKTDLH